MASELHRISQPWVAIDPFSSTTGSKQAAEPALDKSPDSSSLAQEVLPPENEGITDLKKVADRLAAKCKEFQRKYTDLALDSEAKPEDVKRAYDIWKGEVAIYSGIEREIEARTPIPKGTVITSHAFGHKITMVKL